MTSYKLSVYLNPYTLATNPEGYYNTLLKFVNEKTHSLSKIRTILNDINDYGIWHSTIPMCVFYLTGNLTYNYKKQGWDDLNFYGKQSKIDEKLGIKLLKLMVKCGANLHIKNYYMETLFDMCKNSSTNTTLTKRTENKNLIKYILSLE